MADETQTINKGKLMEFIRARSFKRTYPNMVPDGEIWISDKSFDELAGMFEPSPTPNISGEKK
jgi:hypothetical protein